MPSIGLPELAIVLIIALVVFGPKRLPEMGQKLGQALREFRSATSEIRSQIGADEIADSVKDIKSTFSLTGDNPRSAAEVVPDAPVEAVPAAEPAGGDAAVTAESSAAVTAAPAGEAPAAETAGAEESAVETAVTEPAVTKGAPVAGPTAGGGVPFAAAEGDEGGVEAFGSLKRGSAPSPARTAGD